jgi:hypothetical protein
LDGLPAVFWQKRLVSLLACVVMGVLAALSYRLHLPGSAGFVLPIIAGFGAASMGWLAIVRTGLVPGSKGLTWKAGFRTFNYGWSDFETFFVSRGRNSEMVAGVFSESGKRHRVWFLRGFGSVAFGGHWELSPQKIVDALNEARTRWGSQGTAS